MVPPPEGGPRHSTGAVPFVGDAVGDIGDGPGAGESHRPFRVLNPGSLMRWNSLGLLICGMEVLVGFRVSVVGAGLDGL